MVQHLKGKIFIFPACKRLICPVRQTVRRSSMTIRAIREELLKRAGKVNPI